MDARPDPLDGSPRDGLLVTPLAAGADVKVVQALLGHSTSTLTRDTYQSVLPELHEKAGNDVVARFANKRANRCRKAA